MVRAQFHPREVARLMALQSYGVLDTGADPSFDALASLASRLCDTPIALVSLVDAERQWFKSKVGFNETETHRDHALCAHAILSDEPLVIPDTMDDARFSDNPLCGVDANVRFYAGVPLIAGEGLPLGTLCVIDEKPRPEGLSKEQLQDLRLLGKQAEKLLELQRSLARERASLKESVHRTKNVIAVASAIASRTIGQADDLQQARTNLLDRLSALSKAQAFILEAAGKGAPVRALVERQLAAFFNDDDHRVRCHGPEVALKGDAAEGIGLATHELVTNAIKHGSLSVPGGRVDISWELMEGGSVHFEWLESRGPKPEVPNGKPSGFGTVVLGPLATQKIGGRSVLDLSGDGAVWRAEISAANVMPPA
ncbi:GAF domain-containing protein [Parvularcula sp. ZS-1/3]|uniref:histidine kinase n=1 Tax=Parvularcula mediterranea TaxID=2732508 RepID=A0A7Y3RL09_9PROT|nr:HWE histidine kinase domain-containing protein [Parvularcula mediterranea]NNU16024.1 GAF domain-containing protein [Parvularcula mediterranea]